ncbi:MAG TPA: hypothetical protein VGF88_23880, partial [Acidobacteriaceae bacterium]
MIAQTVPVIIGETAVGGLIVIFIGWATKKLAKQDSSSPALKAGTGGLDSPVLAITDSPTIMPSAVVGDGATNSPVAVGMIVHQSNVYNAATPGIAKPVPSVDSTPTPAEVVDFYKPLNPYQRSVSGTHHEGIPVHWRLRFNGFCEGPYEDGDAKIASETPSERSSFDRVGIFFKININEYPRFKIAQKGQILWLD